MSGSTEKNRQTAHDDIEFYSISRDKQGKTEIQKNPLQILTSSSPSLSKEYDIYVTIKNYGTQQQMYSIKTIRGTSDFVPFASAKSTLLNMGFPFNTELPIISKIEFVETQPNLMSGVSKYFSEKHKLELVLSKQ